MKTPDAIKKGLECYFRSENYLCGPQCIGRECDLYTGNYSVVENVKDALAYIQQLEEDRKERDILADAYQQLEAAQPKWTSVKERLPEPFVSVLVYIPEEEPLPQVHEGYITPDETWRSVLYVETYERVAHWMPMPEMPEEEK